MLQDAVSPPAVRDWFVADHLHLETLLEEILNAMDSREEKGLSILWAGFSRTLLAHMDIEERCLIPQLDEQANRVARVLHEEHRYIRARTAGLAESIDALKARPDEIHAFADELRAHASHEDRMLYAWADRNLSPAAHRALLEQLDQAVQSRPRD